MSFCSLLSRRRISPSPQRAIFYCIIINSLRLNESMGLFITLASEGDLRRLARRWGAIYSLSCTTMISVQLNSWRLIWDSFRWNDSRIVRCWGRGRMSKAGPARIRAVLYMAAAVGTRYNPHVKAVYERLLARGKSKMSSLGAAMRKLVHLCFGVLKTQQLYQHDYLKNA
jgi:hypothetical protein